MKQISLASSGFERITKRTRKREFLDEMSLVVPWAKLVALIEPHAPAGKTGRPRFAIAIATMLRIHFLHVWTRRLLQALSGDLQRSAHIYTACLVGQFHARSLDEIRALRP